MVPFDSTNSGSINSKNFDVGQSLGNIGKFIQAVLKEYFVDQQTEDNRFIIATYFRYTMPGDPTQVRLLAVIKAAGPFFHKIIQLVGDFVSDATPEGKELKSVLNEVKRNLLPIDEYHLHELIEKAEARSNKSAVSRSK